MLLSPAEHPPAEHPPALLDTVSVLCAYLSVSFWLFAQLPQVIKNHADKSVDGLSLAFLLSWFLGDLLNLVSCLLNEALLFQTLLSAYYCLVDLVLASQYYYYTQMYHNPASKWYHRRHCRHQHHNHNHNHYHYRRTPTFTPASPRSSLLANLHNYGSTDCKTDSALTTPAPRKVQGIFGRSSAAAASASTAAIAAFVSKVEGAPIVDGPPLDNSTLFQLLTLVHRAMAAILTANIGRSLAWSCTFFYLVSRLPQIYTNYTLKSTAGVSLKLVCFALFGNLFYSMSLLMSHDSTAGGSISRSFWEAELSYFVGAVGTVASDLFVLCQWHHYDRHRVSTGRSGRLRPQSTNTTPYAAPPAAPSAVQAAPAATTVLPRTIAAAMPNVHAGLADSVSASVSVSVRSTLSPSHVKKLNESTPLSPIDFLLDTYVPQHQHQHQHQHQQQRLNTRSHTPSRRSSVPGDCPETQYNPT